MTKGDIMSTFDKLKPNMQSCSCEEDPKPSKSLESQHKEPCRFGMKRLAVFALMAFSPATPSVAQNPESWLAKGQQLAAEGKTAQALQAFDRFKQHAPRDPRPYLYSGLALVKAGRPEDAGMELNQVMQMGPQTPEQAVVLARILDQMDRPQLAEEVLSNLQDASKLNAEDHFFMAGLYQRRRQQEKALKAVERFVAMRPGDRRAHLLRGEIHLQAGELEEALSAFEKAVNSDRQDPEAQDGLGRTLHQGNNPEAAKKAFARAIELDPGNPSYLHLLGLTCLRLGRHQEALGHLEEASRSPQAFPRIFFDLGNAYRQAGDTALARQALTRYQELNSAEEEKKNRSQMVLQLVNQAQAQLQAGAVNEGRNSLMRAVEADPGHWLAHSLLAKIYLSSGASRLARQHVEAIQGINPDTSEGNYLLAFYLYQQRDYQQARPAAEQSRLLRPGNADLRNLLGNIYLALGERRMALQEYTAAANLAPDRFDFAANRDTLAKQLQR